MKNVVIQLGRYNSLAEGAEKKNNPLKLWMDLQILFYSERIIKPGKHKLKKTSR